MAVTSVTVKGPVNNQPMPDTITRPAVWFSWAGGTGPYNVEVVWDDDALFGDANGHQQTETDTGLSVDDYSLAPPTDLDDLAVQWWARVTVTDTADSGSQQAVVSFTYFPTNPLDRTSLHLLANVGVGFDPTDEPDGGWGTGGTVGPDGNTIDFRRHLHLLSNVGVGFKETDEPIDGWGTGGNPDGGDGDEITFRRYLHLLNNVVETQPCPFLVSLSTPIAREGDGVVLSGQGLVSATSPSDGWGAEVRVYQTPDNDADFQVLTVVSYTAGETLDSITVQIPAGVTSGYVRVVHTVTPACAGSNFLFLEILEGISDPEAGWWIEAWTADGQTKKIAHVPCERASVQKILNGVGSGKIEVPADFVRIPEIIDPAPRNQAGVKQPKIQSLLKVYTDNRVRHAFFAEQYDQELADPAMSTAIISGDDIKSYLGRGVLFPQDHPNPRIRAGDWQWGSTANQVPNGNLEDSPELITNGGFEEGDVDPWEPTFDVEEEDDEEVEVPNAQLFASNTVARTGSWSMRINPTVAGTGAWRRLSVQPGERVYIDAWVRDATTSGQTAQLEAVYFESDDDPDDPQQVEVSLASESTTLETNWKRLRLVFVVPADVTQVDLRITNESGSPVDFWLDDATGRNTVRPWFPNGDATLWIWAGHQLDGSWSMRVNPEKLHDGALQVIPVTPGQKLTISGAVSPGDGEQVTLRAVIGGVAHTAVATGTGLGDSWTVLSVSGTVAADETQVRFGFLTLEDDPGDFLVDAVSAVAGSPATTAGGIVLQMLEIIQGRGDLPLVTTDFTQNITSNGATWAESAIAVTLRRGTSLLDVLNQLATFGIDWDFTHDFVLRMFNRKGIDRTLLADCPVLRSGTPTVVDGKMIRRIPRYTDVFAEGGDGIWLTATNPADEAAVGGRTLYLEASGAATASALQSAANNALDQEQARTESLTLDVSDVDDHSKPWLAFDDGDSVLLDLPGVASMQEYPEGFRVMAVTADLDREDPTFTLSLNWMVLEDAAAQAAALRLLLEKSRVTSTSPGVSGLGTGGTIIGTGGSGPHTHQASEIDGLQQGIAAGSPAGGDLAGTYPAPTVMRVRNRLVATPTAKGDLWVYNGSQLVRLPVGPTGRILKANPATPSGLEWAVESGGGGGGAGGVPHGRIKTSTETAYLLPGVTPLAVGAATGTGVDTIFYAPIVVDADLDIDGLAAECTAGSAAGRLGRIGLYEANLDWQPTERVIEGQIDLSSTGIKTVGANFTLPAGRYLTAITTNHATPAFRFIRAEPFGSVFLGSNKVINNLSVNSSFGTLPDPGVPFDTIAKTANLLAYRVFLVVT